MDKSRLDEKWAHELILHQELNLVKLEVAVIHKINDWLHNFWFYLPDLFYYILLIVYTSFDWLYIFFYHLYIWWMDIWWNFSHKLNFLLCSKMFCFHTQRNLIESTWNEIVDIILRLIWIETDVRWDPNQSENGNYNLIFG